MLKKVLLSIMGALAVLVCSLLVTILSCHNRTFDAPFPELAASTDPAVIEHGRYLAYGPAHCNGCHGDPSQLEKTERGEPVPLSGGYQLPLPLGALFAPNITPDPETGIGKRTDAELARSLRHGVGWDGRALFPVMPFTDLSDEDLIALLSFLRAQEPVRNEVPAPRWSMLGKALRTFVLGPVGPSGTPPSKVERDATVEYGKYLAHSVANCNGCHTDRDLQTGAFIGEPFAGGLALEALGDPTKVVVSQNITTGGKVAGMQEDAFLQRMRAGTVVKGTHMPWASFRTMSDDDLRAIYRYLQTVQPSSNDPGPPIRDNPAAG